MDKFFSSFGKIMLLLIVVVGFGYLAYSYGTTSTPKTPTNVLLLTTPMPSANQPIETATPTSQPSQTVTAGLDSSSGLSFTKYQMTVPESWTPNHTTTNEGTWVDTLVLTKGENKIKIFQAATGGAMCLYPTDADFEGPSSRYDSFMNITTSDGIVLRRGTNNTTTGTTKGYSICQKNAENYGQPTVFGHMSITLAPDTTLLSEVDAMLASLKKLP